MKEKIEQISKLIDEINFGQLEEEKGWYAYRAFVEFEESLSKIKRIEKFNEKYNLNLHIEDINCYGKIKEFKDVHGDIYITEWANGDRILNTDVQPKIGEKLMVYCFPTGAYIFGDEYFESIFNDFFEELKAYNYSYIDDMNDKLYFDLDNGIKLYKEYDKICLKYQKKYDFKKIERKKAELEKELRQLEEN